MYSQTLWQYSNAFPKDTAIRFQSSLTIFLHVLDAGSSKHLWSNRSSRYPLEISQHFNMLVHWIGAINVLLAEMGLRIIARMIMCCKQRVRTIAPTCTVLMLQCSCLLSSKIQAGVHTVLSPLRFALLAHDHSHSTNPMDKHVSALHLLLLFERAHYGESSLFCSASFGILP